MRVCKCTFECSMTSFVTICQRVRPDRKSQFFTLEIELFLFLPVNYNEHESRTTILIMGKLFLSKHTRAYL